MDAPGDMSYPISMLLKSPDMSPKQLLMCVYSHINYIGYRCEYYSGLHFGRSRVDVVVEWLVRVHVADARSLALAHHVRIVVHRKQRRIL